MATKTATERRWLSEIGKRLREVREVDEGLSTREWTAQLEKIGFVVSHTMIGRYEHGTPSQLTYGLAVCQRFDINPEWLLFGTGTKEWRRGAQASRDMTAAAQWAKAFAEWLDAHAGDALTPTPRVLNRTLKRARKDED